MKNNEIVFHPSWYYMTSCLEINNSCFYCFSWIKHHFWRNVQGCRATGSYRNLFIRGINYFFTSRKALIIPALNNNSLFPAPVSHYVSSYNLTLHCTNLLPLMPQAYSCPFSFVYNIPLSLSHLYISSYILGKLNKIL